MLVVSPTDSLTSVVVKTIARADFEVVAVRQFQDGRANLADAPALVVTELKLGAYNGLHLAIHAAAMDIPTIVIADRSYRREIEQMGAVWLSPEAASGGELAHATAALTARRTAPTPFARTAHASAAPTFPLSVWQAPASSATH